ncbi:MAG: D-2-hydroxyacid dehydrogenase [Dehalococcoidales bacterium]|nr:D-2-hydroxyacid dehydrogenase [Dehalococcoidales bacterium]
MDALNVLVLTPAFDRAFPHADEECLNLIRNAVPDIKATDGSALLAREMQGDAEATRKLDALLAEADILFGFIPPQDLIRRGPKVKWLQVTSAGVDRLIRHEVWNSSIMITGVSGIHATAISEFVLGTMLMFAKGALHSFENMQKHEWGRYMSTVLHGRTVGIVGLGNIGREIARLAKAFDMRVIATCRSIKKAGKARNVDVLLPQKDLKLLLAESDYVALAVPLTHDTQNLIGEAELKAMKPTAYLINIARGGVIDENALNKALKNKQIAGAGLDVTAREPLPADSPLWDLDNVILSPHVSGGMEDYMLRATELFCENLKRRHQGKKLLNVVRRKRGY